MHKSSLLGQIELAWLKQDKSYEFFPLTTRLSINEEIYYSLSNNNLQYDDHHLYYGVSFYQIHSEHFQCCQIYVSNLTIE